ncbi:DNA-directed RNA polymerase [Gracilaria domingensis]|nr:DNA-directed RNA polymerase [Gracilaria domingensis]
MDENTRCLRSLDVSHAVRKFTFRFYSEEEVLKLSVRRITSAISFDELGRPVPFGLYDPVFGPTSFEDGACVTCGLTYASCPGHFGHIELPIAFPNPLSAALILKLLRSSCWNCHCLCLSESDLCLYYATLLFEDADSPQCGFAVDAYRTLRKKVSSKGTTLEPSGAEAMEVEPGPNRNSVIKNWYAFLNAMPQPIPRFLRGINIHDTDYVERAMLESAKDAWKQAKDSGSLARHRSKGWKAAQGAMLASSSKTSCTICGLDPAKIRTGDRGRLFIKHSDSMRDLLLSPADIEKQIKALWEAHSELFELLYGLRGREVGSNEKAVGHERLFVRLILVPPSRFRPSATVGDMSYAAEHPQNIFYQRILTLTKRMMDAQSNGTKGNDAAEDPEESNASKKTNKKSELTNTDLVQVLCRMQQTLGELYDNRGLGADKTTGIKQQLETKRGLFRQHMMGKRVDYSCRSVIGPDVFLDTNEVGIPLSFAKQLTIPEPVIPSNLERMKRAVLNGPDVYPGATAVEDWTANGERRVVRLNRAAHAMRHSQASLLIQNQMPNGTSKKHVASASTLNQASSTTGGVRVGNQIPKVVHRHLKTGDVVLFNRQPTLHRVSIMAHRVRILPGDRTIRFHYANCGSYNADFDGDEMNVHIPQDYLSRAEAEELMLSNRHYIVPTSGAPVRGLIQDHIASATILSRRDTFLDRQTFTQLLYVATERIMLRPEMYGKAYELQPPAILKPRPLWTGKQLISAVLAVIRNRRPGFNLEAGAKAKANIVGEEESKIIVRDGQLLQGIVDKSSLGASTFGIVHAIQETYGCRASDDFLSSMSRLCLYFLRYHGHTTGIGDLVLMKSGDMQRLRILTSSLDKVAVEATNSVYEAMNQGTRISEKLAKSGPDARQLVSEMIQKDGVEAEDRLDAAMKSSLNQVSSNVFKACVPIALSKPFPWNGFALMTNTGAKGGPVNAAQISCLLGQTSLEGKRVPRMGGSGATLPCFEPYDASPVAGGFIAGRFLTGISPQEFFFHAMSGREGLLDTSLKTANSGYLQRCLIKHLEGVRIHYDGTVRDSDRSVLQFIYGDDGIDPSKSLWLTKRVEWQVSNIKSLGSTEIDGSVNSNSETTSHRQDDTDEGSTVLESISPGALNRLGAVSDTYSSAIKNAEGKFGSQHGIIRRFLEKRYQQGAIEAGEAVGILAAQGIGEPSTQMTLNTFHHAGSSSAHVTLGIPRLRELLMTASRYPNTPSMTLPVMGRNPEQICEKLSRKLRLVRLSDLMLQIEVHEKSIDFLPGVTRWALRTVDLKMKFPSESVYKDRLGFGFERVMQVVEKKYLPGLHDAFEKELLKISERKGIGMRTAIGFYLKNAQKPASGNKTSSSTDDHEDLDAGGGEDEANHEQSEEAAMLQAEEEENAIESSSDEEDDSSSNNDEGYDGNKEKLESLEEGDVEPVALSVKPKKTVRKRKKGKVQKPKVVMSDDDEDLVDFGSLGYVNSSIKGFERNTAEFQWVFPMALLGKLNVSALMKEKAMNVSLSEVERIKRCFVNSEDNMHCVVTEGSNILKVHELGANLVEFNRLETNDMYGILQVYGVEALRAALVNEFTKVFDAYGIPVNIRHLSLIADYMTATGEYRGFNRRSMSDSPGMFQRVTFETSMKFLQEALLNGVEEFTTNPSSATALGQVYEGGTGGFQLLHTVN